MTSKPTPGPWERRGSSVYGPDTGPGTASFVCECHLNDKGNAKEDARFIAATPQLLEALELALGPFITADRFGSGEPTWSPQARAAIKAAKGES